jgi:hypothetical protein
MAGSALPRLTLLPALAAAIGIPHEDLLLTWLADSDRENTSSYHLLAAQLMGVEPTTCSAGSGRTQPDHGFMVPSNHNLEPNS